MKTIFLYIFYFFRSLYYRGLFKTLKMLRYEGYYEKLLGIKTMQIKKSEDTNNFHYQGASYYILFELFKKLPEYTKAKNFIDIGSGKGRALFCAEKCGFNHLIGVELDPELVTISNENIKRYLLKRKESTFTFVCENALHYQIPANSAVFYFFNPFSDKIMLEVQKHISLYQKQNQIEVYVIYVNPNFRQIWTDSGYEIFHREGNNRYTEALIFKKGID